MEFHHTAVNAENVRREEILKRRKTTEVTQVNKREYR